MDKEGKIIPKSIVACAQEKIRKRLMKKQESESLQKLNMSAKFEFNFW